MSGLPSRMPGARATLRRGLERLARRPHALLGLAALAVLAAAVLATGCSNAGHAETERDVTLTIWVSYNNEEFTEFQSIVREFETTFSRQAARPVRLVIGRVPFNGLLPKLKAACLTGMTPDIVRVDCAHVVPMAWGQALIPLDTLKSFGAASIEEFARPFVPAAIRSCIVGVPKDGRVVTHLYGVPDQTTCVALFYNRRLFAQTADRLRAAGLDPARAPDTWDELRAYARALTVPAQGQFGYAMDLSLWWTLPVFFSYGAQLLSFDEHGAPRLDLTGENAEAALRFLADLWLRPETIDNVSTTVEAGAWRQGAVTKDQGFINGRYAMVLTGPWNLKTYRDAKVDFGVALAPRGPVMRSSAVGGTDMVVFRSCRHPDVALEFLRFLTSTPVQGQWAQRLGQLPVRQDAFSQVDTRTTPELAVFMRQLLLTQARPPVPNYDKLEEIVNLHLEMAVRGDRTAHQALEEAAARVERDVVGPMRED